jgi:sialidase-1
MRVGGALPFPKKFWVRTRDRQTGILWLVFCKNNQAVFVMNSQDDGVTWNDPVEITRQVVDPTWKYIGAGPGHAIQLRSGRLLISAWGDT